MSPELSTKIAVVLLSKPSPITNKFGLVGVGVGVKDDVGDGVKVDVGVGDGVIVGVGVVVGVGDGATIEHVVVPVKSL